MLTPINERFDAVCSNISVVAIKLSCASDTEAINTQATCHYLRFIIKKGTDRRTLLALLITQIDGNRVAFNWIDVDAIA